VICDVIKIIDLKAHDQIFQY